MPAIDTLTGYASAPSSTPTALTMSSGDSLTVKNSPAGAFLTNVWGLQQTTAGTIRIGSGRIHNLTDAMQFKTPLAVCKPYLPMEFGQPLFSQDTLTVDITGSATAGDLEIVVLQLYYPLLPGSEQNLAGYADLKNQIVNLLALPVAITAGTSGGWSGAAALNASYNRMKANVTYALLGVETDVVQAAISVRGPDTGGLRCGAPGTRNTDQPSMNNGWFVANSKALGVPFIPRINGANQGSTFVEVANDENAASPNAILILAQLR